jgi:hypothetical protein
MWADKAIRVLTRTAGGSDWPAALRYAWRGTELNDWSPDLRYQL